MPEPLAALDAFLQEHRRRGDLDGGVEDERVWMACAFGADIAPLITNLPSIPTAAGCQLVTRRRLTDSTTQLVADW
jgi:Na+/H+ antiporter NhaD/arsenite permease-like protein